MGTVIMAVPGCSDSWDDHYNVDELNTSASETLWQKIKSNPKLTKYAAIAEKAAYYKDEQHKLTNPDNGKPFTFSQMLNGTQLLTVWAPEDAYISDADYNKWMQLAETNPYSVQQQLMANSIALWRNQAANGGVDSLRMLNGKILVFDKNNYTMANLPISERNIAAKNGTLHTLAGTLPFNYNLYEYLKDEANTTALSLSRFHDYVIATDTTYFQENGSIEGNPDIYGNPTYVDSVYMTTNSMFFQTKRLTNSYSDKNLTYMESFGANIESEDSTFIMLLPTDAAWQKAYDKIKGLYKYANNYVDNEKGNNNTLASREITDEMMDSLLNQSINMDIISPLVFNLHEQPNAGGQIGRWDLESFMSTNGASAEYLLNTYGDTLRSDANWDKTQLFQGTKVKMSNGYGIITDEWNIPTKLYKPNLNVEIGWQSFYNTAKANLTGTATPYNFSNEVAKKWINETGKVSHNNFYYLRGSGRNSAEFEFKLVGTDGENEESEVMSGKYDIYVVMVPNYYMISSDSIVINENVALISGTDTIPYKHKITATLNYTKNEVDSKGAKNAKVEVKDVDYQGLKVDTLLLFENFEFPYSYKNLRYSYPTLSIKNSTLKTADTKAGYSTDFCIDRIILVAKDDE